MRLAELDVAAFGANHGAGPAAALGAIADMRDAGRPLAVLPNVGLASMSGQRIVFPHATPAYFGQFAAQARALGAAIIGGCCGTTPAQIAAIRAAIDDAVEPAGSLLLRERERSRPVAPSEEPTQLQRLLDDGEFVVSVQLDPPLGANPEALLATARAVRTSGKAQLVDVNDNPRARARMSGIMACVAIERLDRRRDDPAPDAARHDDRRPRVGAARRARGGCAQHPLRHGRSAGGRRLSRARTASTRSTRSASSS